MILKKIISASVLLLSLTSCQIGYYFSSGLNQWKMANTRELINEELLKKHTFTEDQKNKILLSQKARVFAFEKLKLKETKNYSTYIDLGRPYVTWVVQAAEKWQMKTYEWSYPIVGNMPYKGFFNEADAEEEAREMQKKGYDTYVRGVSAYSTLGWFQDSLLSSMLRYKEHDLVNTIIHEITHTTIYIKNNADFNEKLAVFIGAKGSEMFYKDLEGEDSKTLKLIKNENADDVLFAKFVTDELAKMTDWYTNHKKEIYTASDELERQLRLSQIIDDFANKFKTTLKTNIYYKFEKEKMNNAKLGMYKTYMENLDQFEVLYKKLNGDLLKFIDVVKTLEKSDNPEEDLKKL
ncbi:MAG: aminopeptidase [Bdellovibrionaceae bacterium]|nr:aminopeptidase [Pseudobdellovibrionaceae bacterium]